MRIRDKRIWMLLVAGAVVFGDQVDPWAQEQTKVDAQTGGTMVADDEISLKRERWQQMNPEQQKIMRRRLEKLKSLSLNDRRRLQQRVRFYKQLPSEQKELLRERWQRFERLSPEEKREFKKRFQQWKKMSPEERGRIQDRRERFQELTPERRKELKERREQWRQNRRSSEDQKFLREQTGENSTGQMKFQNLSPGVRSDGNPAFERRINRPGAPTSSRR